MNPGRLALEPTLRELPSLRPQTLSSSFNELPACLCADGFCPSPCGWILDEGGWGNLCPPPCLHTTCATWMGDGWGWGPGVGGSSVLNHQLACSVLSKVGLLAASQGTPRKAPPLAPGTLTQPIPTGEEWGRALQAQAELPCLLSFWPGPCSHLCLAGET